MTAPTLFFKKGQYAERSVREVPAWYIARCIGDTTNDGVKWGDFSDDEKEQLQSEITRREKAAAEFWKTEQKRLADNAKRRAEAKGKPSKAELEEAELKQKALAVEAEKKLEKDKHDAEVAAEVEKAKLAATESKE